MTSRQFAAIGLVGGILMVVGSLLPWATVATVFGEISIAGTRGDGTITLVVGALAVLLALWRFGAAPAAARGLALLLGVLGLAASVYDLLNVGSRLSDASSDSLVATVGIGLYVVVGGAILVIIGSMAGKAASAAADRDPEIRPETSPAGRALGVSERLRALDELRAAGSVSEEEYTAQRSRILAEM